ncbi:abortive infection family protein [Demequina pelophila]|uniref:abortive infection family protein n=1 Tax=Demequina pelophila TaxID=1638984 RepID=UPI0009E47375|nr:abortive infection family protein [Demequina pelophila]
MVKGILRGAATVAGGLAGVRNALGEAHGRGKGSVGPAPRRAKLAVGGFLIDAHIERPARKSDAS